MTLTNPIVQHSYQCSTIHIWHADLIVKIVFWRNSCRYTYMLCLNFAKKSLQLVKFKQLFPINSNRMTKSPINFLWTSLKSLRLRDLLTLCYFWLSFLVFGYLSWPSALLSLTGPLGLTAPDLALLGLTGPYWALMGLTGPYWASLGLTGPYRALQGLTGPYWA